MKWLRRHLPHCAPATLLLFAAAMAVPRAAFVVHSHAGGGHEHVHVEAVAGGDGELDHLLAEALGEPHGHPHDGRPALENPSAGHADRHWHAQAPFHRAVVAALPALASPTLVTAAPSAAEPSAFSAPAPASAARAPPSL